MSTSCLDTCSENVFINGDCIEEMKKLGDNSVAFSLIDIPYDGINRASNGLRSLDKGKSDVLTFNLNEFLNEVYRVTEGGVVIFCYTSQVSEIFNFFKEKKGTVRSCVWHKTNPSPMNGTKIYLSALENFIWFKKPGATFNAHCKHSVFTHPSGRNKIHPTEKNHALLQELILDNTNPGDIVLDCCAGSGSTLLVAGLNDRRFIGVELDKEYYNKACERLVEKLGENSFRKSFQ